MADFTYSDYKPYQGDPGSAEERKRLLEESLSGQGKLQEEQAGYQKSYDSAHAGVTSAQAMSDETAKFNRLYSGQFNDADRAEAAAMGIDVHNLFSLNYLGKTGLNGQVTGALSDSYLSKEAQIRGQSLLERQQAESGAQSNIRRNQLAQKEMQLKHDMLGRSFEANDAVDRQLTDLLNETGIGANYARSQVGASMAEHGMSRSSGMNQAIGDVTNQELQQKGQERFQAAQLHQNINNAVNEQDRQIALSKDKMTQEQQGQYEANIENELSQLKNSTVQNFYDGINNDRSMGARERANTTAMIGGLVKGAASLAMFA